jgi:long-chain acyl-CoA synthetase
MGGLVDRGVSVLVFPEGERSQDGRVGQFRNGLAVMARELAVPVVPVAISGLERVLPRGALWPRRGRVVVTFGEPLDLQRKTAAEIVSTAEKAVMALRKT